MTKDINLRLYIVFSLVKYGILQSTILKRSFVPKLKIRKNIGYYNLASLKEVSSRNFKFEKQKTTLVAKA